SAGMRPQRTRYTWKAVSYIATSPTRNCRSRSFSQSTRASLGVDVTQAGGSDAKREHEQEREAEGDGQEDRVVPVEPPEDERAHEHAGGHSREPRGEEGAQAGPPVEVERAGRGQPASGDRHRVAGVAGRGEAAAVVQQADGDEGDEREHV